MGDQLLQAFVKISGNPDIQDEIAAPCNLMTLDVDLRRVDESECCDILCSQLASGRFKGSKGTYAWMNCFFVRHTFHNRTRTVVIMRGIGREAFLDEIKRLSRVKDAFLSNLSHERRTPLVSLMLRPKALGEVNDHDRTVF